MATFLLDRHWIETGIVLDAANAFREQGRLRRCETGGTATAASPPKKPLWPARAGSTLERHIRSTSGKTGSAVPVAAK